MNADRTVRLAWTCAVVCAAVAALLWWNRNPPPLPTPRLARFTFDAGVTTWPAISADGRLVAYASDRDSGKNLDLYVQPVVGGEAVRLTQTPEDESEPDFSPDGGTIAYRTEKDGGGIWTVPVAGGQSRLLVQSGHNPRYSPDGKWVAYWDGRSSFLIPSAGGSPKQIGRDLKDARSPVWSPDGRHLLLGRGRWVVSATESQPARKTAFNVETDDLNWAESGLIYSSRTGWSRDVYLCPFKAEGGVSGTPRHLTNGAEVTDLVRVSRTGRVAFTTVTQKFNLWGLPVDTNSARVTGELFRITDGFNLFQNPAVSEDGRTVYYRGPRGGARMKDLASGQDSPIDTYHSDIRTSPSGRWNYWLKCYGYRCAIEAEDRGQGPRPLVTVYDSDTLRLSLGNVNPETRTIAVARDKIVMILAEQTSNIWLMDLSR